MATKDVKVGSNMSLPIKEFKLESMCENPAIVMIAKRASGKSWVCRAILKHFKDIPVGIIIAPTEKMANPPFYSDFFPDSYIHYEYRSDIIEKLLYRQDKMIEKQVDKEKLGKKIDPRGFILMDDCLSTKGTWMKDQPVMELLFNGRHYRLMYLLTMQFPLGITPELRCNFDYIFLLAEDFYSNLKRLYDHYAGMFPTFDAFRAVFKVLTDDYGSMVIVNRGARANFLEKVYWFKASNEKVGMIGCKQFIKYHERNYDAEWKKRTKAFDINEVYKKKSALAKPMKVEKVNAYGENQFKK
jgi:hypothetical protein